LIGVDDVDTAEGVIGDEGSASAERDSPGRFEDDINENGQVSGRVQLRSLGLTDSQVQGT
jgi:hypothetical protein